MGACSRCGSEAGEQRWCATCGLDLRPGTPALPTPDSFAAAERDAAWRAAVGAPAGPPASGSPPAPPPERAPPPPAPPPPAPLYAPTAAHARPRYRPLRRRALFAERWVGLVTVLSVAVGALEGLYAAALADPERDATGIEAATGLALLVQVVALLLAAGFFIAWLDRAHRNVEALGMERRHWRGWAILGWFVPVMHFFRPKQIVNDTWRAGDPDADRDDPSRLAPPLLLGVWWGAWIVANLLASVSTRLNADALTRDELRDSAVLAAVGDAFTVVAGVVAIVVIRRVTERQEARGRELAAREAAAAPPVGATPA